MFRNEDIHYLTIYGVSRNYGGPEEGGWWFDNYFCIYSEPTNPSTITSSQLENRKEQLEKKFDNLLWNYEDIRCICESKKRMLETKERPYYS